MKPRKQIRRTKKKNSIWAIKLASIKNFGKNTTDKEWTKKSNEEVMQREPREQYRAKPDIPESTKNSAAADSGTKKTQHARSTNHHSATSSRTRGGNAGERLTPEHARSRSESSRERDGEVAMRRGEVGGRRKLEARAKGRRRWCGGGGDEDGGLGRFLLEISPLFIPLSLHQV